MVGGTNYPKCDGVRLPDLSFHKGDGNWSHKWLHKESFDAPPRLFFLICCSAIFFFIMLGRLVFLRGEGRGNLQEVPISGGEGVMSADLRT